MGKAGVVELPALVTIVGVEVAHVGDAWPTAPEPMTITQAHLDSMVAAGRDPRVPRPVLKLGHTDERFNGDGQPALGRLVNLRYGANRESLVVDVVGVPAWLAHIWPTAYPSRSFELVVGGAMPYPGTHDYSCVLTGLALLGETWPAITVLEDIRALFGMEKEVEMAAGLPLEQIAQAVQARLDDAWAWVLEFIQGAGGLEAIVELEDQSTVRVPVAVGATGEVEVGEPVPVRRSWLDTAGEPITAARVARPQVVSASVTYQPVKGEAMEEDTQLDRLVQAAAAHFGVDTTASLDELITAIEQTRPNTADQPEPDGDDLEEDEDQGTEGEPDGEGPAEEPETVSAEEVQVLRSTIEDLKQRLEAREQELAVAASAKREHRTRELLTAAVADGRISPAARDREWAAFFAANAEAAEAALADLPVAYPMGEIGGKGIEQDDIEAQYRALTEGVDA